MKKSVKINRKNCKCYLEHERINNKLLQLKHLKKYEKYEKKA